MSEPVQLVAVRVELSWFSFPLWRIYAAGRVIGRVSDSLLTPGWFWGSEGERLSDTEYTDAEYTAEAAAVALAKDCGIPNPIPPKEWP